MRVNIKDPSPGVPDWDRRTRVLTHLSWLNARSWCQAGGAPISEEEQIDACLKLAAEARRAGICEGVGHLGVGTRGYGKYFCTYGGALTMDRIEDH